MTRGVAVITGGAGGMGLAAARLMGSDHVVVISDVNRDRLDGAAAALRDLGIACEAVTCDITDRAAVDHLVETACAAGPLAALVHAAGVSPAMGDAEMIIDINAVGTLNVNEAFLRVAGDGFAAVNVASMAAHMLPSPLLPVRHFRRALRDPDSFAATLAATCRVVPRRLRPGMAYSLSKSFVRWYSASQAGRFGQQGARILSVSPGSIDTEMGRLEEASGAGAMIDHSALGRFGTADELAEVLVFCAGDKAAYLTGTDILCDGGVVAGMTWKDKLTVARA